MRKNAFTLIELLIVVAIIAILAAIAVPNFLEAETRAKVSRVKADMKSIVTALEAYCVDYNKTLLSYYPWSNERAVHQAQHTWLRFEWQDGVNRGNISSGYYENNGAGLTTPIAYIGSIPYDPFTSKYWRDMNSDWWDAKPQNTSCMYAYGAKWDWVRDIYGGPGRTDIPILYPDVGYAMYSCGPDNYLDWPPIVYDPTNGTISNGNIHYVRGAGFIPLTGLE